MLECAKNEWILTCDGCGKKYTTKKQVGEPGAAGPVYKAINELNKNGKKMVITHVSCGLVLSCAEKENCRAAAVLRHYNFDDYANFIMEQS